MSDLESSMRSSGGGVNALRLMTDVALKDTQNNDILQYDSTAQSWKNVTPQSIENVNWGEIVGDISNQTDLKDALDLKWSLNGNTLSSKKTLGSIDNQDFGIITNNLERLTVLKGGNVGIGTTAPDEKLHLHTGNFKIGQITGTNSTSTAESSFFWYIKN